MALPCLALYKISLHKVRKLDDLLKPGEENGFLHHFYKHLVKKERSEEVVVGGKAATHVKNISYETTEPHKNSYLVFRLSHGNYGYTADIFDTGTNQTVHRQTVRQASQRPHDVVISIENQSSFIYVAIGLPTGKSACFTFIKNQMEEVLRDNARFSDYRISSEQVSITKVLDDLLSQFYTKRINAHYYAPESIDSAFKRTAQAVIGERAKAKKSSPIPVKLSLEAGHNRRFLGGVKEFEAKRGDVHHTGGSGRKRNLCDWNMCRWQD